MNPIPLQKQLRDNAADLNDFYKDLKAWGEEMRKNEEFNKQSIKKIGPSEKKKISSITKKEKTAEAKMVLTMKRGYTDYSAWDKFNAEAECEKIDLSENDESDLTDEFDETVRDEAYLHKEKGNGFVKDKQWDEAIECYNKAIACYSYDPVFYANRALCFLKREDYLKAELDCSVSIKLDGTYVKAFQRRAAAREALLKLIEAELDLIRVLELEPHNQESKKNLDLLRNKLKKKSVPSTICPVSKFTASRNKGSDIKKMYNNQNNYTSSVSVNSIEPTQFMEDILVKAILKPTHLQSKKPLRRITIQEIKEAAVKDDMQPLPKSSDMKTLKTDDLRVFERGSLTPSVNEINVNKNHADNVKMNEIEAELVEPVNSVQFYSQWRYLQTLDKKYVYLKLIKAETLPFIFKESMESKVFTEILEVLVKCFITNGDDIYIFLNFLSEIKRFSALVMFMDETDKTYLRKLFDYLRHCKKYPHEQINCLVNKYELC